MSKIEFYKIEKRRSDQYDRYVKSAKDLFLRRNSEYGDSISEAGLLGSVCELIGIAARLKKIVIWDYGKNHIDAHTADKLRDILMDGLNYCAISIMMIDDANFSGRRNEDEQYD